MEKGSLFVAWPWDPGGPRGRASAPVAPASTQPQGAAEGRSPARKDPDSALLACVRECELGVSRWGVACTRHAALKMVAMRCSHAARSREDSVQPSGLPRGVGERTVRVPRCPAPVAIHSSLSSSVCSQGRLPLFRGGSGLQGFLPRLLSSKPCLSVPAMPVSCLFSLSSPKDISPFIFR